MTEKTFSYSFALADYIVMAGYMAMLLSVGFLLKKLSKDVKDYFIGGNRVSWYLAGASCFMMSFSAWTFTGAAGFAYKYGILILCCFFFNPIIFMFIAIFIAHKCRQTRRITWLEIIHDRFGRITEQFLTWIQVPMMLFSGAIWLSGLATFVSVSFGLPIETTIILSGAVILVYSTMAGSWGVMATDFLQSLILMILTFVIAALTLIKFGGLSGIKENLEPEKLQLVSSEHSLLWIIAYGFNIFFILSSLVYSPRFLSVTDGKSARKAAAFASVLFFLGPVIWFIPPIAASFYFRDVSSLLPGLNHPEDAAYVLMGLEVLPHGLAGLLIMVVFAATLSSMDTAINQNAAIICMNIYKPIFRPKASPRELFIVAHLANLLFGVLAIFIALIFVKQQQYSLFDLMFILLTCITLPLSVPLVLVYWIKRAPQFSAIISIIAGIAVSLVGKDFAFVAIPHRAVTGLMNRTGFFTLDPALSWPIEISIFAVVITCSAVFLLTVLFWNTVSARQRVKIEKFYDRMNLPVDRETEVLGAEDNRQFSIIGMLAVVVGIGIGLLSLFQGDLKNVLACLCTGLPITLIGLMLRKVKSPQANR